MLQANHVHIADIEKICGAQVRRQILLFNLKADHFRVLIPSLNIIH